MEDDYVEVYNINNIVQRLDDSDIYDYINDNTYNEILNISIKRKKEDIIRYIVSRYKCDERDIELKTPLHLSIIYNISNDIICNILVKVDVNAQDIFGNTALHYSMLFSDDVIVMQLLRFGSHPLIKNNKNKDCIYYSRGNKKVLLLKNLQVRKIYRNLNNELIFSPHKYIGRNCYLSK